MNGDSAELLRQLREHEGISIETLHNRTGISKKSLAAYEAGEDVPRGSRLTLLSMYYGVPEEELVLGKTGGFTKP